MLRLDELKRNRETRSKSFDSEHLSDSSPVELQSQLQQLQSELDEKEKDMEILRLRIKSLERGLSIPKVLESLPEIEES